MAPHPSYPRTRLYIRQPLGQGVEVQLGEKQAHYLLQVLRRKPGDAVALFNGSDGEWQAALLPGSRKTAVLQVETRLRPQTRPADIWLLCAPLKGGKTEWVVEKATELGVARICPVRTQFTVADRLNESRLLAIAAEAAEQCERLELPVIDGLIPLATLLDDWQAGRRLIYGDESGAGGSNAQDLLPGFGTGSMAVLIGPEGGFSASELELLRSLPYVSGMCLGPRVLRADTAAIAALALVQAFCGDWEGKPAFRTP
jgi:16S rRNA (uracil1498-N3)-methyltransferase